MYRDMRIYFGLQDEDLLADLSTWDGSLIEELLASGTEYIVQWQANVSFVTQAGMAAPEAIAEMQSRYHAISSEVLTSFVNHHFHTVKVIPYTAISPTGIFMLLLGKALRYATPTDAWLPDLFSVLLNYRTAVILKLPPSERLLFTIRDLYGISPETPTLPILACLSSPKVADIMLGMRALERGAQEYFENYEDSTSVGTRMTRLLSTPHLSLFACWYLSIPSHMPCSAPAAANIFLAMTGVIVSFEGSLFYSKCLPLLIRRLRAVQLVCSLVTNFQHFPETETVHETVLPVRMSPVKTAIEVLSPVAKDAKIKVFGGVRVMPPATDSNQLLAEIAEKLERMKLGGTVTQKVDSDVAARQQAFSQKSNFSQAVKAQAEKLARDREARMRNGELLDWEDQGKVANGPPAMDTWQVPRTSSSRHSPRHDYRHSPRHSPRHEQRQDPSAVSRQDMRFSLAVKALMWKGIRKQDAQVMAKSFLDDPTKCKIVDELVHKKFSRTQNSTQGENELFQKLGKLESFAESGFLGKESSRDLGRLRKNVAAGMADGPARIAVNRILHDN